MKHKDDLPERLLYIITLICIITMSAAAAYCLIKSA